ncbi:MAG: GNAT family N-acetyltransferase [Clostridia bacterium]|nr:GNAT family N-acetyltransferase [Clostridia bacterium]
MLEIRPVSSKRDMKEFVEFPLKLYRGNPYFVPALYGDEMKILKAGGTKDADTVFFLAVKDGKTVGRVQGILQKEYNRAHGTTKARFGRFDTIDDLEVAKRLLGAVEDWAKEQGMTEVCGPLGYSDLDREGLLIDGFDQEQTFEAQYNYEYSGGLIENAGYAKDVDWLEFQLRKPAQRNEMLSRLAKRALEMNRLHVAPTKGISKRKYIEKYRDGFFDCLDVCYRDLYGTVKLTREAQDELISQFLLIVNKEYAVFICDKSDTVVGFGICFPGIGKAVMKSGGRLTPMTLMRILKTVRNPSTVDLGLVAVRPEYQARGVNAIILNYMLDLLEEGGVKKFETNLNLEDNFAVMNQWKYFDARQNKRRRSYIKKIGE